MTAFPHQWFYEFLTLLVVLDPIATVPVFMAVTHGLSRSQAMKVGAIGLGVAFLILLFFIIAGRWFLQTLEIPMASFQLAGSLILLLIALSMVTGKLNAQVASIPKDASLVHRAIYPLAMPVIAGAGGILTVVMLADNHARTAVEQGLTILVVIACLSVHFVSFFLSSFILRLIGLHGVEVFSRVFGLMLASIAVNGLIISIKLSFGLA